MIENGVHGRLESTILPISPAAWTSFATGKNPGSHGIYDFAKRSDHSYSYRLTNSLDSRSPAIWDTIGSFGGSSIVVNVPLTYPPKPLRGSMITGFPTPKGGKDCTYPRELLGALKEKFGDDVDISKPQALYRKGREAEITEDLVRITRAQTAVTAYLMQSSDWNLAVSVFDAPDVCGHYFWAYLDKSHPKYDGKLAEAARGFVEEIHVALDDAIGELTDLAGPDSLRIVMSDHGFGPVYYGVYINNWLVEREYMRFKTEPIVKAKHWAYRNGFNAYNLLRLAKKLRLIRSVESAYSKKSLALKLVKKFSLSLDDIDWERTKVYSVGNFGQLYVNMKGREPKGIVPPEEVEPLVDELVEELGKLKDPKNQKQMFDCVYKKQEAFVGRCQSEAPDIVFFDSEMKYAAHRMFELGSSELVTPHPIYSGHHKMDGLFAVSGSGIRTNQARVELGQVKIVDMAPTILQYLGVPAGDFDGRILREFFDHNFPSATRPLMRERAEEGTPDLEEEAAKLKPGIAKLRSLGFL
jgi:predicted AlkP superfamily phosphohydrolase/phosphomutase